AGPRRGNLGSVHHLHHRGRVRGARRRRLYADLAPAFSRRTVCHAQQAVLFAILPAAGHRLSRAAGRGEGASMSLRGPLRVGVGGPVGSGKTALVERLCKKMRDDYDIAVVTNDIYTKEDAEFLTRAGAL